LSETKSHVVILGGGFGGLYTALELEKRLKRRPDVTVTLLNDENFFLFTPMLPEAGASSIGTRHIVSPLRKLLRRTRFAQVAVESIDLARGAVSGRHSLTGAPREFRYEHLVIALGGVSNYFNIPGAKEYSLPFKTLSDAIYVRNHTIDKLEEAAVEPERVGELLTFVVVGGGLTGVEVTGAINDFVREAARYYPEIDSRRIRMMLIEAGPRLMPELSESLAAFSEKVLTERGVEVRTGTAVVKVEENAFELSTGERIETGTLIWSAGVMPNPHIAALDVPKERGRIRVSEDLEVEGRARVWALGDCAYIFDPGTNRPHPPTAQHAVREGKRVARNIAADYGTGRREPFRYRSMGQMAIVGERRGVAEVMGYRFSGLFAWFLWRTYYLFWIPQLEKRVRVVLDWTLDLFFTRDLVQLAVTRERGPASRGTFLRSSEE
jgi:NADH dehydrogenase